MDANDRTHVEWVTFYEALLTLLSHYGENNAFGEGDYWLVDDDWGSVDQKLIISNPRILTRSLVAEISTLIKSLGLLGASVMIAFEPKDKRTDFPAEGIVVHSGGFTEYWDKALLREKLGSDFEF